MKNPQVARLFQEIADMLELSGDNPFRIRAYRRAAMNIEAVPKDVAAMTEEELRSVPGIGKDLAVKIREYADTGRVGYYEELQNRIPPGLLEILQVPGIGPKTARLLHDARNVRSLEELEALARSGGLAGLPGIKEKTEENIRRGIEQLRRGRERIPLGTALPIAAGILEALQAAVPGRASRSPGASGAGRIR